MTERPEGAPDTEPAEDAAPGEPEAAPEAETVTGAPEAAAAADEELEGEAGEFEAETEDAEADEIEDELEAEEADGRRGGRRRVRGRDERAARRRAGRCRRSRGGRPDRAPSWRAAPTAQRAPTLSEQAVHVADPASRLFVIATVVVFAAILAFGLLAGNGGLLTRRRPRLPRLRVRGAVRVSGVRVPSVEASASPS